MDVTKETRLESFITRPLNQRSMGILQTLGDKEMTARQIAYAMGYSDLNAVKPRLTELKDAGILTADKTAYDSLTGRHVAVWRYKK